MMTVNDINDQFLVNSLTSQEKAIELVRLYYNHSLDLNSIKSLPIDILSESQVYSILFKVLKEVPLQKIIEIIKEDGTLFEIEKADICQFSDFNDCYTKALVVIINSGLKDVSWTKLGFLLRNKPRKSGADQKYGENHGKTAAQLGLLQMNERHEFNPTSFGIAFNALSKEDKESLKPKFCLYIPIIHNYFTQNCDPDLLDEYLALLSESTQKRRKPNIKKLIEIVKSSLPYDL